MGRGGKTPGSRQEQEFLLHHPDYRPAGRLEDIINTQRDVNSVREQTLICWHPSNVLPHSADKYFHSA